MRRERGVTLAELVVSIAVISIAALALFATLGYINANSGNTMLQAQAQAIATAYLNEITAKPFVNVGAYNGLDDASARDRAGNVVANFRVRVSVVGAALNGVPAADSQRVDVTVDYGTSQVVATGYRMRY
jgi:MSHA pilin protein MshD